MLRCRVYWGSHGCRYKRGHRLRRHRCECAHWWWRRFLPGNVGAYPYYGSKTTFYGEDVQDA